MGGGRRVVVIVNFTPIGYHSWRLPVFVSYLALLRSEDEMEYDELEPPVPLNLASLNAPLKSLVDFMRIDTDLVAVAAENSTSENRHADPKVLKTWIGNFTEGEKNDILFRLIGENNPHLGTELELRFRQTISNKDNAEATEPPRTVESLLNKAETYAEERKRKMAEQRAKERAQRAHEKAVAREKYLDNLIGQEDSVWKKVNDLITYKPAKHDEAVKLLVDLKDLNKKIGKDKAFNKKLKTIRETHSRKSAFLSRLKKAGLGL